MRKFNICGTKTLEVHFHSDRFRLCIWHHHQGESVHTESWCLCVCVCVYVFMYVFVCVCTIYVFIHPFLCLSVCLSVCLPAYLPACLPAYSADIGPIYTRSPVTNSSC
jgi:hypothetical protein